ncbi:MAG: Fic family protein [Clostridiales bacterium]|nr:Fic family protein [Clostridiales bacterium]
MSDNYNFGEDIPYELAPESTDRDYKRNIWDAAIGLQAVDGLKPSEYLRKLAEENINGQKTYEDVSRELNKEYGNTRTRQHEADLVSCRIAQLLEQSEFKMSMDLLLSIHDFLFDGVLDPNIVGKFRRYNIKKKEPILFGDTVHYTDHLSIKSQLQFYLEEEKEYNYSMPLSDEDIDHLSSFTRKIWQTHPFGEGNTRTTAVFIEMYLISLGSRVDNEPFKDNSQFYRNALVRSCYSSEVYAVKPTNSFLNHFYKNLLCGSEYVLDSFDLFISNKEDINYSNDDIPKDTNNDPDPFG